MKIVYFFISVFAVDYDDKSMHLEIQKMDFDGQHRGFKVRVPIN